MMIAIPSIILWELGKRRNALKHDGGISFNRLVYQVNTNIWQLVIAKYSKMQNIPSQWPEIIIYLDNYKPRIYHRLVHCRPSDIGTIKCNTDGASKGNPH